jgi:hypothetical protein
MPSRGQQLGKLLNPTGDIVETSLPPKIETFSQSVSDTGKVEKAALGNDVATIEEVSDITLLTASGNSVGDQRVVGNNLYIWNGSGWFRIALINETPTWDSGGQPLSSYDLSSDSPQTATTITLAATDPDGFPINYSYTTGGSMDSIGTISQDSSVFTITPKTEAQAPDGGTGSITFRASDGVNILPQVSSFTLQFSPDWSTGGSLEHTITGLSSAGWDANLSMDATGERLFIREYESSSVFALGIYKRTGSSWALEQEFTDPTDSQIQYNPGSHLFKIGENGDWVAWNRAASSSGVQNRITFARRSGTTWTTEQVGDGNNNYWFISGDGNHVFNPSSSDTTTVLWRFQYSGGTWSQNNCNISLPGVGYRRSGGSNYDGTEIILGNYSTDTAYRCSVSGSNVTVQETLTGDSGKLFPFYDNSANNSIVFSKNGLTLAIYQRYSSVISGSARQGKIFIYRRSSTSNNFGSAAVTYSGTSATNNYLGSQLSISDDGLFVAFGEDIDNNVFIAELDVGTGNWTKHSVNIPAGEGGSTYVTMSADASRIAYWGGTLSASSSNKCFIYKV